MKKEWNNEKNTDLIVIILIQSIQTRVVDFTRKRWIYLQQLLSRSIPFFCHKEEFTYNQSHFPPVYKHGVGLTLSEFTRESQISLLSTSCVQMHDSNCTMWVKNKKQTHWLNSLWLIQMVSSPPLLLRMLEKIKARSREGRCLRFSQMWLCNFRKKRKKRTDAEAGFEFQLKSVSMVQLFNICWWQAATLAFSIWPGMKWNCQNVESESSHNLINFLYSFILQQSFASGSMKCRGLVLHRR